jgi:hypothetical protein
MRIAARPRHCVGPHQQTPASWMRSITAAQRAASPNATTT